MPERVGDHEFFVQQLPGRPHPCYMRRRVAAASGGSSAACGQEGPPWQQLPQQQGQEQQQRHQEQGHGGAEGAEVVLDVNELAVVHGEYVQVGQVSHVFARLPACMLACLLRRHDCTGGLLVLL